MIKGKLEAKYKGGNGEYHLGLINESERDRNEERRRKIDNCSNGNKDGRKTEAIGEKREELEEVFRGRIRQPLEEPFDHDPELVPARAGYGGETRRYFRINFSCNHGAYGWVSAACVHWSALCSTSFSWYKYGRGIGYRLRYMASCPWAARNPKKDPSNTKRRRVHLR